LDKNTIQKNLEFAQPVCPEATAFLRQHFPEASDLFTDDRLVVQTPDFSGWYSYPISIDGDVNLISVVHGGGTGVSEIVALRRWVDATEDGFILFEMIGGSFLLLYCWELPRKP
jgi:hypothetical protein